MRHLNLKRSTLAIAAGALLTFASAAEPSQANESSNSVRRGLPGRRISGGSRSINAACLATPDQPVVAIMPKSNLGLTLSQHPTFWFALPAISPDRTLEFGLYDSAGDLVYTENFQIPEKAGISSLSLPKTVNALDKEENYRWYLSVVCDPNSRSEDLVVTGWIRRTQADSTLQNQLANATLQERLSIYATSNLWFETLSAFAEIHDTALSDTALSTDNSTAFNGTREQLEQQTNKEWVALLESIDLPQLSTTPFSNQPIVQ